MQRNNWGVSYSTIEYFEKAMNVHDKVLKFQRDKDILFTIKDIRHRKFKVLLLNEYRMSLAALLKAADEFPGIDFIIIGGNWNKCTPEAKEHGLNIGINILDIKGFMGAINCENPKIFRGKEVYPPIED